VDEAGRILRVDRPLRRSQPSRSSSPAAGQSWLTASTTARSGPVGVSLVFGLIIMVMVGHGRLDVAAARHWR
jgi:hypothetical protein